MSLLLLLLLFSGCSVWENTTGYFNTYYNATRLFDEAVTEIKENRATMANPEQGTFTSATMAAGMMPDMQPDMAGGDGMPMDEKDPYLKEQMKIQRQQMMMMEAGAPSGAVNKLDKVIKKCSRLLVKFEDSDLVDDALMLIGKSYFHKMEIDKAERKFKELIEKYPDSPLVPEAILWLGKTYARMIRFDLAREMLTRAVEDGIESENPGLVSNAYYTLGRMSLYDDDQEQAVEYYKQAAKYGKETKEYIEIYIALARELEKLDRKEDASAAYLKIIEEASDNALRFIAELNYARLQREIGDLDEASNALIYMLDNPQYLDYDGKIQLEIAHLYFAYHKLNVGVDDSLAQQAFRAALDQYHYVDTTFAGRSEASDAFYALGQIYEIDLKNYDKAYENYNSAKLAYPGAASARLANKKTRIFGDYRKLRRKMYDVDTLLFYVIYPDSLSIHDSLRAIQDSLDREQLFAEGGPESTLTEAEKFAQRIARRRPHGRNTGTVNPWLMEQQKQTLATQGGIQQGAVTRTSSGPLYRRMNLETTSEDSVRAVLSDLHMEMGWHMFDQIGNLDSARYYYILALDRDLPDSLRPQGLYTLATIARNRGNDGLADDYETQLVDDYPNSFFARSIMIARGMPLPVDSSALLYERYEEAAVLFEQGQPAAGRSAMQKVIADYPHSKEAVRAKLAIAMSLEDSDGDNALEIYRSMVADYPTSPYSKRGTEILAAIEAAEKKVVDDANKAEEDRLKREAEAKKPKPKPRPDRLNEQELRRVRDSLRDERRRKIDPTLDADFPLAMPGAEPEQQNEGKPPPGNENVNPGDKQMEGIMQPLNVPPEQITPPEDSSPPSRDSSAGVDTTRPAITPPPIKPKK